MIGRVCFLFAHALTFLRKPTEARMLTLTHYEETMATERARPNPPRAALLAVLQERLTETEMRRLTLRYGLDGGFVVPERRVAEWEGVALPVVQRTITRAVQKLRIESRLWALWLLVEARYARIEWDGCQHCGPDCRYLVGDTVNRL